jgi:DNA-binding transcriptional MerR regulator
MKMHIRAFAELTGVSVRTLHYYDEIGLLKPAETDPHSGYRFYDRENLVQMQEILFYRELDFPLKDIRTLMTAPHRDRTAALSAQKHLLTLKKARLERMIAALEDTMKGAEPNMKAFDNHEFEAQRTKYAKEAKARWGHTDAYRESEQKAAGRSRSDWNAVNGAMDALMAEFAACMQSGAAPDSAEAQALVKKWQDHITANHYTCTKEILAGLGMMYTADPRFTANMDRHAPGTAAYMSAAIAVYCK